MEDAVRAAHRRAGGGTPLPLRSDAIETAVTGSLRDVKALSGYFPAGDGEVSFVLILNGDSASDFQTRWDLLGTALLSLSTTPEPAALAPVGG